jgi:hypothetical protein
MDFRKHITCMMEEVYDMLEKVVTLIEYFSKYLGTGRGSDKAGDREYRAGACTSNVTVARSWSNRVSEFN